MNVDMPVKPPRARVFTIETAIILLIAGCILFLNIFTTSKLSELERINTDAMFVNKDLQYTDSEALGEEIIKYRPESSKLIEMYDGDFNLLFSLQFDDTIINNNEIKHYPELINLLNEYSEGQTTIKIDGYDESVHFQWVTNSRNERRLIIVYSTKREVKHIWAFSLICYVILLLVSILLIRVHYMNCQNSIKYYQEISARIRSGIMNDL